MLTALWTVLIVAAAPLIFEVLDDAGLGISIVGLSVTGGEMLFVALLALVPPLTAALLRNRTKRSR
jgi:hypothetical protein